ncbi:MAG: molybdenum cofactor guanylyltransferase [Deltaproteobacteria bacterium]|nr:molybdenum cofactor guanylyltransferase [Deltaproteobacteria bacterium]
MLTQISDERQPLNTLTGVTGIILAGGKSSRYGSNKALVELNGIRLIERTVTVMKAVFQEIIVITNTPADYAFLDLPMVRDLIEGLGPIGGVYTGLETIARNAGFFVACDMPLLKEGLLRHMVDVQEGFDAVVPRMGWMIEPLHALYTKSCLPVIKASIDAHQYQIAKCFQGLHVRYLEKEELLAFDPELISFFNINEPKDLPPCAS